MPSEFITTLNESTSSFISGAKKILCLSQQKYWLTSKLATLEGIRTEFIFSISISPKKIFLLIIAWLEIT